MICLIDGDVLLHEIGWSNQFIDKETGEEVLLSAEHACEMLDKKIDIIKEECMSDEAPILFISASPKIVEMNNKMAKWSDTRSTIKFHDNFRKTVAKTKEYKGQRKNPKPNHFYNLVLHMLTDYNTVISQNGLEADDELCIAQRVYDKNNISTVICSRDKDLRICPGWHYSWECGKQSAVGPHYHDGEGSLSMTDGKVLGYGILFFCYQLLAGDSADNITGLPKYGPSKAFKELDGKTVEEAKTVVKQLYKEVMGENSKEYFLEQANLLWMIQEGGTPFKLERFYE